MRGTKKLSDDGEIEMWEGTLFFLCEGCWPITFSSLRVCLFLLFLMERKGPITRVAPEMSKLIRRWRPPAGARSRKYRIHIIYYTTTVKSRETLRRRHRRDSGLSSSRPSPIFLDSFFQVKNAGYFLFRFGFTADQQQPPLLDNNTGQLLLRGYLEGTLLTRPYRVILDSRNNEDLLSLKYICIFWFLVLFGFNYLESSFPFLKMK